MKIGALNVSTGMLIVGGVVGAVAVYLLTRNAKNIASAATSATVGAAAGIIEGAVLGIGDVVGVPRTDHALCVAAQHSGDNFSQLTYCTVPEYASFKFTGKDADGKIVQKTKGAVNTGGATGEW